MDDRTKTLAAVAIIIGFIVLVVVIIGAFMSGKKVVSPVPEEGAIKIIFVTPTPAPLPPTATPSATPKQSVKTTPKPTATPKPTPTKSVESTSSAQTPAT